MRIGAIDVGGTMPLLKDYRFLGSGAGKTAVLLLYGADGLVAGRQTITVGTSALLATDNDLWSGDWSEEYVGAKVVSADASIYILAPYLVAGVPTQEVDATYGTALEAGLCFGMVPMVEREKYVAASVQIDNLNISGTGLATSAKQDTLQTAIDSIEQRTPNGYRRVEVAVAMPDSAALAAGDLLFEAAAIADAVRAIDKHSTLVHVEIVDEQLVMNAGTGKAFDVWFEKNNSDWGTVDSAVAHSITNARNMLGLLSVLAAKYKVLRTGAGTGGHARMVFNRIDVGDIPFIPKSGTRIVYFSGVAQEAIDTSASTSPFFYFTFHMLDLN